MGDFGVCLFDLVRKSRWYTILGHRGGLGWACEAPVVSARRFRVGIEVMVVGGESCGTRWAKNHSFPIFDLERFLWGGTMREVRMDGRTAGVGLNDVVTPSCPFGLVKIGWVVRRGREFGA